MLEQSRKVGVSGGFINQLMGNNKSLPIVGKGATMLLHSDRHTYEVIEVSKDFKTVVLQRYKPKRLDSLGMSDAQSYEYKELEDYTITLRYRNKGWKIVRDVIVFTDKFNKWINENEKEFMNNKELRFELWKGETYLSLVEGKTRKKKEYSNVSIIFGVLDEYYDYSL